MRIAFKTFGCRLNHAEALDAEARFEADGHQIVELDAAAPPDVIVVRGWSVTAKAQHDCDKEIARLRRRFPTADIRLTGCLPPASAVAARRREETMEEAVESPIPLRTSRAYLKVQDGCSGRCAFCIVPHFRGPPVSVPFAHVLARARAFLAAGYRELVVTGCNLALSHDAGRRLPDLLAALAVLTGPSPVHRIRLGSLEPGLCAPALLDVMAAHPKICRFLHLSLQSGSNRILKRMNRPYTVEDVSAFCAQAVHLLGTRLALGADVIAGFPGETDTDHAATLRFHSNPHNLSLPSAPDASPDASHVPFFSLLHVFPYSERPGTPAATMEGALPRPVRLARARELEALGHRQRAVFARSFVGQEVEVCVERGGDHGWTAEYLPCRLVSPAPRRSLVTVRIASCDARPSLTGMPAAFIYH